MKPLYHGMSSWSHQQELWQVGRPHRADWLPLRVGFPRRSLYARHALSGAAGGGTVLGKRVHQRGEDEPTSATFGDRDIEQELSNLVNASRMLGRHEHE